jgi:hypothetical protein
VFGFILRIVVWLFSIAVHRSFCFLPADISKFFFKKSSKETVRKSTINRVPIATLKKN